MHHAQSRPLRAPHDCWTADVRSAAAACSKIDRQLDAGEKPYQLPQVGGQRRGADQKEGDIDAELNELVRMKILS